MSSPTVQRAVSIITFFADHPGKAFTLSEVAVALKISPSTCHVLLKAFVQSGLLFRSSDKVYHLGPVAYRLADAARASASPLQAAVPYMRKLADRFDAICLAVALEGDEWIIRDSAFSLSHLHWPVHGAARLPNRAPFGAAFMAWAPAGDVKRWLDDASAPTSAGEQAQVAASLALARHLGFSFGIRRAPLGSDAEAQALLYRTDQTEYLLAELDEDAKYNVAYVSAPVFDGRGRSAFLLTLVGFSAAQTGAQIKVAGEAVRAACFEISWATGGLPQDSSG